MKSRKEIVCKNCGAVYYSDEIPAGLRCTCLCEDFCNAGVAEV